MPKKKAERGAATASVVCTSITCPGCKSEVSSDGQTLHKKSAFLDGLIETDAAVDELEKEIDLKLNARDTAIADLRAQLKSANEKLAAKEIVPNVDTKKGNAGTGTAEPARRGWDW